MQIKNRHGEIIKTDSTSKGQKFLYNNIFGRILLKILIQPVISKIAGFFMNSRFSKIMIKFTLKKHNYNMSLYKKNSFTSYNDFFTRKLKEENIKIDIEKNHFISPCDSKLSVYTIDKNSSFKIKNSYYNISSLLKDEQLAEKYHDGFIMIFRLEVTDYHRYIYIDNGSFTRNFYIKGVLHTVNPIAITKYPIYKQNSRSYAILKTENFGNIIQMEVGALMVGKIKNHHENYSFIRGEEKGLFLFGGSTIVLLAEKNRILIDSDIIQNSLNNCETIVRIGEKIGVSSL
jgi:phosphatidylserine decarboxylase